MNNDNKNFKIPNTINNVPIKVKAYEYISLLKITNNSPTIKRIKRIR